MTPDEKNAPDQSENIYQPRPKFQSDNESVGGLPMFKRLLESMEDYELEAELANCRESMSAHVHRFKAMDAKSDDNLYPGERAAVTKFFWASYDNLNAVEEETQRRATERKFALIDAENMTASADDIAWADANHQALVNEKKAQLADENSSKARDLTELVNIARRNALALAGSLPTDGRWNPEEFAYDRETQMALFAADKLTCAWERLGSALLFLQEASGHIWHLSLMVSAKIDEGDNEPAF